MIIDIDIIEEVNEEIAALAPEDCTVWLMNVLGRLTLENPHFAHSILSSIRPGEFVIPLIICEMFQRQDRKNLLAETAGKNG